MAEWIDVNIPWRDSAIETIKGKEISAEISRVNALLWERAEPTFGEEKARIAKQMRDLILSGEDVSRIRRDYPFIGNFFGPYTDEWLAEVSAKLSDSDSKALIVVRNWNHVYKYNTWIHAQPEYLELSHKIKEIDSHQFCTHPACRPGVLIEVKDGKKLLIGHMNACGNLSGYDELPEDTFVVRYCIVWSDALP